MCLFSWVRGVDRSWVWAWYVSGHHTASSSSLTPLGQGTEGAGQIQHFNFTLTTSLGYSSVANRGSNDFTNTAT